MKPTILRSGLTAVFGVVFLLCMYVSLFRDASNTTAVVSVTALVMGGLLLSVFWGDLSEVTLGPWKAKIRDLGKQVDEQKKTINAIRTALEGIITKFAYDKLEGLERDGPFMCKYHSNLFSEMKQLYDRGFVKETMLGSGPKVEQYRGSGQLFDLKDHFLLDEPGRKYIESRRSWQM